MKRNILNSFIFFLIVCPLMAQTLKTNFILEENNNLNISLNGKVKSVTIKRENLINKNDKDSVVYFFNSKGDAETIKYYGLGLDVFNKRLRVEEIHYIFKEKKLISKLNKMEPGVDGDIYDYDNKWNLVHVRNYMGNILVKENYLKYDSKNRMIEQTSYLYGAFSNYNEITQENKSTFLYEIEKYDYDANDKLILKSVSNFRGNKKTEVNGYKYDERGNLIEEGNCLFFSSEKCTPKPIFGYDYNSNNQLIKKYEKVQFSPHNTDEYFEYDEKGNKIESKGMYVYRNKLPFWGYHFVYEYDEFGNKTKDEEVYVSRNYRTVDGKEYKKQITQYDKFQNKILDEYLAADGSCVKIIIYEYVYDKNRNWISMQRTEGKDRDNLIPSEIYSREIIYKR